MSEVAIPDRPALAPWCRLVEDDGRVLVEHGGSVVTFEGRAVRALLPRLLPLLDGTRRTDEIVEAVGPAVAPAIENALTLLAVNQLLVDGPAGTCDDEPATAAGAFAAAATRRTTHAQAIATLRTSTVQVLGSSHTACEVARSLRDAGVGSVEAVPVDTDPSPASLLVAAPDPHEVDVLDTLNERAVGRGSAWLQVLPYDGRFLIVGPLFLPGASACRACFVLRRAACSGYERDFGVLETEPVRAPSPRALPTIAAGLVALLAIRWLTVEDATLPGSFYAFETGVVLGLSRHRVLRVPRCPVCGPPERAIPSPWFEDPA